MKLIISEPCNQTAKHLDKNNWFCTQCRKEIIDFTKYSDSELIQYFKSNHIDVCGHFTTNQLDKDLKVPGLRKPKISSTIRNVAAFLILLKSNDLKANILSGAEQIPIYQGITNYTTSLPRTDTISIKVMDENNLSLQGINLLVNGEKKAESDHYGVLKFYLPADAIASSLLELASFGFYPVIVNLGNYKDGEDIVVKMRASSTEPVAQVLYGRVGGVNIVKRTFWQRTKRLFHFR